MAVALVVGVVSWVPVLAAGTEEAVIRIVEPSRDWLGGIPEAPTEDWEVAFGGRLYDNWARAALTVGPGRVSLLLAPRWKHVYAAPGKGSLTSVNRQRDCGPGTPARAVGSRVYRIAEWEALHPAKPAGR